MNTRRVIGVVVAFMSLVVIGCSSGKKGGGGGGSGSDDVPVPTALVAGDVISVTLNGLTDSYFSGKLTMTVGAGDTIVMNTALPAPFDNTTVTYVYASNGISWDIELEWYQTQDAKHIAKLWITGGRFGDNNITWTLRREALTEQELAEAGPDDKIPFSGNTATVTRTTP